MSKTNLNRREALGVVGALLAGCSARGEPAPSSFPDAESFGAVVDRTTRVTDPDRPIRWAPADELVSSMEFEEQAQRVLPSELFRNIAGSNREPFERITFRPRMNVPTLDMDLGASAFGQTLFSPLVIAPMAQLGNYHRDGESALIRGAGEGFTRVIVSSRSSVPFSELAQQARAPLWYAVDTDDAAPQQARAAVDAGASALFVSVGAASAATRGDAEVGAGIDWRRVDAIRQGLDVPVAIKGIVTASDASAAIERGIQAIVVSNHASRATANGASAMDALAPVVGAADGRVPVLIDGSFRRGSDVIKALALGAEAVLIGRPAVWALAAYGSDGIRSLLALLHEELARSFGMLGVSTPAQLTADHIRVHRWATT